MSYIFSHYSIQATQVIADNISTIFNKNLLNTPSELPVGLQYSYFNR